MPKGYNLAEKWKDKISKTIHLHCYTYNYKSRCYEELLSIKKRWYPEGRKIVPKDIKLTPLTLRQFYIGDGSLICPKDSKPYIVLYTYGFTVFDVNWLVNELNRLGFKTTRWNASNTIHISTYSTKDFLDYIGNCPVRCYSYKWNYQRDGMKKV